MRIDRATAIEQVGIEAVEYLDSAIPEQTNRPQADGNVVEFAALFATPTPGYLKAYYYQDKAALNSVDGDLSALHWSARDYEVLT